MESLIQKGKREEGLRCTSTAHCFGSLIKRVPAIMLPNSIALLCCLWDSRNYTLEVTKVIGDCTGALHIGPGQQVVVHHPDELEFIVNVYVYEGGTVILPPEFECMHTVFSIRCVCTCVSFYANA